MNLIIIHKNKSPGDSSRGDLLRFALAHEPIAGVVLDGLRKDLYRNNNGSFLRYRTKCRPTKIIFAIPQEWKIVPEPLRNQDGTLSQTSFHNRNDIISYTNDIQIPPDIIHRAERKGNPESWLIISNGRFATWINNELLGNLLSEVRADIIAVNAEPELIGQREKMRITTEGNIAGFRRLYSDTAELTPIHNDWPHHLFVKARAFKKILTDDVLPESFSALINKCRSNELILRAVNVGGNVLDLETENGLLEFCKTVLATTKKSDIRIRDLNKISKDSRFFGKVLFGKDVQVGPNVTIVGPTIISDNVYIEQGAVINSSIIGPKIHIPQNQVVNNTILKETPSNLENLIPYNIGSPGNDTLSMMSTDTTYRHWPWFSYARCFKRIADCLLAVSILILFAPLIPFIAAAIKLSSPGPVFFRDKRQGLHGREFNCLKFRTMVAGAGKIQEKLRFVSHVDGPQFKMVNDPRISAVGRFLRETYIDEIPQFFNVLLGQMSVVGPRPSPEPENTLCPFWREARLSVRPGITGLWQILRTRIPMKDFQEWIRYDTEYVRNLSFKMDLWICWKTIKKLVEDFMNQF